MSVTILAAVAQNGVIGRDGGLPWKLSGDLKRFKADTMGKPIVMGRKTWQGLGRPLPGRMNIVVTRDPSFDASGAALAPTLDEALAIAERRVGFMPDAGGEICVIGGGEIYAQAMTVATRLRITHVLAEVDGDTLFPAIDPGLWHAVSSADFAAGERDSHPTRHTVYERIEKPLHLSSFV